MSEPLFENIALVGIGLIGSSLARVIRREGLASEIVVSTRSADTLKPRRTNSASATCYTADAADAVRDADLVIVSVPVGASGAVAAEIAPASEARRDRHRRRLDQALGDRADAAVSAGATSISSPAIRSPAPKIPARMPVSPTCSTIAGAS